MIQINKTGYKTAKSKTYPAMNHPKHSTNTAFLWQFSQPMSCRWSTPSRNQSHWLMLTRSPRSQQPLLQIPCSPARLPQNPPGMSQTLSRSQPRRLREEGASQRRRGGNINITTPITHTRCVRSCDTWSCDRGMRGQTTSLLVCSWYMNEVSVSLRWSLLFILAMHIHMKTWASFMKHLYCKKVHMGIFDVDNLI